MLVILKIDVGDKVLNLDQWNFDTKNVKYSTIRENKF